jgi:8-oxo-dGTP diphosphatase
MTLNKKNIYKELNLKYTICFCIKGDEVLMVFRKNEPNKDLWNGLGGKIEKDETPDESVKREILEEAGIDLNKSLDFYRPGIVTWKPDLTKDLVLGMYAYIAVMPKDLEIASNYKVTEEGELEWKKISWVCNKKNFSVVNNIPYFLPPMLEKKIPTDYYFEFENSLTKHFNVHELPDNVSIN